MRIAALLLLALALATLGANGTSYDAYPAEMDFGHSWDGSVSPVIMATDREPWPLSLPDDVEHSSGSTWSLLLRVSHVEQAGAMCRLALWGGGKILTTAQLSRSETATYSHVYLQGAPLDAYLNGGGRDLAVGAISWWDTNAQPFVTPGFPTWVQVHTHLDGDDDQIPRMVVRTPRMGSALGGCH